MTEVKSIPLSKIKTNPLNPRKYVDEKALQELAQNIKEIGLIQPIIVRPNGEEATYEIICGERRFRACQIAQLPEINVEVLELEDKDVLMYMVTENMQREDIQPMEEAAAMQALVDQYKMTIDELIAKFGKTAHHIRLRLKLNDLIKEFKELLSKDIIGVGHAQEICKLSAINQKEYFKTRFEQRGQYWGCPSVKELKKEIEKNFMMDLSKVNFDPKDEKLVKKAGACTICPKNTSADAILFDDMPVTGVCLDRVCFKKKVDTQFKLTLKDIMDNEPDTMLCRPRWLNGQEAEIAEAYKKDGIKIEVIDMEVWAPLDRPEEPEPFDEADLDEEDNIEEAKLEYADSVKAYTEELAEYEQKIKDPATTKCFMVVGDDKGEILYLIPKKSKKKENGKEKPKEVLTIQSLEVKLDKMKHQDVRNKEIYVEKVYKDGEEAFEKEKFHKITLPLSQKEKAAFVYLLSLECHAGSNYKTATVAEKMTFKNAQDITQDQLNSLYRNFIETKMLGKGLFFKDILHIFMVIFEERFKATFDKVKGPHLEVLNKRIESIAKRGKELTETIKTLKQHSSVKEVKTPVEAKKPTVATKKKPAEKKKKK